MSDDETWTCDDCEKDYKTEAGFDKHMESVHSGSDCDRSCHYCRNDCVNTDDPHRIHRCENHN